MDCAIELQNYFLKEPKIPVRIGIHVGDIIRSKYDIVGDAVNIASRIESCAVPGSILISDKVHDHIRSHRHIKSTFLDAYELKNVEDPMPIFAISNEGLIIPKPGDVKGKLKSLPSKKKAEKRIILILIAIFTFMIFSIGFYWIYSKKESPKDVSIAVLPFDNLSTDEDSEIFRDGITEEILTYLSKLKDLRVISRTSVVQYKETKKSIPEIAKELDVRYILEGSIRKYGDKIRINAQLIDAATDEHIWSEDYDRTIVDILRIQSEVSKEIVDALQLNFTVEDQKVFEIIPTENIDAYQLFLRGKQEADKRTKESIEKSVEFYKQAIEIDPKYAESYAEIANSIFLQTYYGNADPVKAHDKAKFYLDKAEKINDKISRIYTVRGLLYNYSNDFEKAKSAFEKAVELSPNDVTARHQYSTFFYYVGDYQNQLKQAKIAYKLDPLSFATASNLFSAYTSNELYREAEKLIDDIVKNNKESDPFVINRLYMRLYMAEPDYKKAIEPLKYLSKEDPNYLRILGYSYGQLGDTVNAYNVIDKIKKMTPHRMQNHRIAVVFAGLNENDSVFYYLDTIRNKSDLFNSDRLYYFDDIKKDSRYKKLLEAHNIK